MQAQENSSCTNENDISLGPSKKPIPLPRSKVNVNYSSSSSIKSDSSSSSKGQSFRNRVRSISINEKGKAVLESTKTVGSKLKNVLSRPKRQTCVFHDDEISSINSEPYENCQSLPVNDIFEKISFGSPLDIGTQIKHWKGEQYNLNCLDEARQTFQCNDDTTSDITSVCESLFLDDTISLPPPEYPPPPLPTDTCDDASSQSGSYYTTGVIDTDSFYEEVISTVSRLQNVDLTKTNSEKSKIHHSRSDSWNFFNTPSCFENLPGKVHEDESNYSSESSTSHNLNCSTVSESCGTYVVSSDYEKRNKNNRSRPTKILSGSNILLANSYDNHRLRNRNTSETDSSVSVQDNDSPPDRSGMMNHVASGTTLENVGNYHRDDDTVPNTFNRNETSRTNNNYENWKLNRPKTIHNYENWKLNSVEAIPNNGLNEDSNQRSFSAQDIMLEFDPFFEMKNVPEPPERVDSICNDKIPEPDIIEETTKRCDSEERVVESPTSEKKRIVRWSSMKKAIKNFADNSTNWAPIRRGSGVAHESLINKSELGDKSTVCNLILYSGVLFKSASNDKTTDMVQKYFHLGEGKLSFGNDKTTITRELFTLESILSIKRIPDIKQSVQGEDVYCFFVSVSGKSKSYALGASCTSERRVWMQKLLESCTPNFSTKITSNFTKAGRCYLKKGVTDEWTHAWVVLDERQLFYSLHSSHIAEIDLKKARCIAIQEGESCNLVTEGNEFILVDTLSDVLYLQMDTIQDTYTWRHDLKTSATNNGPLLIDQQLTKDEIPTLVDKCINFVFAHGSMSEGIYRRNGSNSNVTKLLAQFRQDAWSVQISRSEYTEYDVASVLKRFFRDLPEPLLTTELHKHLCNTTGLDCSAEDKCNIYRSLLEKLPPIHYVTVRKLMCHLYFIQQQKDKNLMSVENLASIWGPTLMHVDSKDSLEWSKKESESVSDLIALYPKLFLVEEEELLRESKMMQLIERYHNSSTGLPQEAKPSGDLKVWIFLGSKGSANCVNVALDPAKEAGKICEELADRMNTPSYELCLMEIVCEGSLTRVLHHREKVLDVVLEWGYWDDTDCKDNALILTTNEILRNEIAPLAKQPQAICGQLKFADRKSKSFKSYLFEFSRSKLCYYKDKKGSVQLGEWNIENIIWYVGYEKKRNPQTRWSITFINKHKPKRSKEYPYFGFTIAGCNKEEQCKWMAALIFGQYSSSDLLPKASFL